MIENLNAKDVNIDVGAGKLKILSSDIELKTVSLQNKNEVSQKSCETSNFGAGKRT